MARVPSYRYKGHAAGMSLDVQQIEFLRLGGSTRLAAVLGEMSGTSWKQVEKSLIELAKSTAFALPTSGKFHLGLSAYGFDISPAKLNALGLTLKKVIRSRYEGSVRLVPNNETELGTAQVIHNRLVTPNGAELLLIADSEKTYIAKTICVQDIASYTLRDRGRPKRDARVGMLPPKLAQIIINLAAASQPAHPYNGANEAKQRAQILDPFCGTGVILQEAILSGFTAYGSDLEERMVAYSQQNIEWLLATCRLPAPRPVIEIGDATTHVWQQPIDYVACETYLGRPFTEQPSSAILAQTISEVNLILKRFLQNIAPQLKSKTRLCLAVPCWFDGREQKHLPLIQHLSDMEFERIHFKHALAQDLIYHREGQIVGRELVTLQKK
ncbi:hypothetical protein IPL85_03540 [Candidatus Saccharibacteria bacterium]|nr:MAG: hypothetical protein IPL85_03540 [Candidatus Saccharibacteria bacterium]